MRAADSETDSNQIIPPLRHRRRWTKVLKVIGLALGGFVVLCVLACVVLDLYLTPRRLARMVSEYADRYLDAEVHVDKISFTIWSTFPHFELQMERAVVVSHRLDTLPASCRRLLPAGSDTLASVQSLSGSINPLMLLGGCVDISRLQIKGLRLNMVALNDTVNNYDIFPSSRSDRPFVMPRFRIGHIQLSSLRPITYYSAATQASARIGLSDASMTAAGHDTYRLLLGGNFSLGVEKVELLRDFPFVFSGRIAVDFNPFRISSSDYDVMLGNMHAKVDMSMQLGDNDTRLDTFHYKADAFDMMRLFEYLPAGWLPSLRSIRGKVNMEAWAKLTSPYRFSSDTLPSFDVDFHVPDSWLACSMKGMADVKLHDICMDARLHFNGADVDASVFDIRRLSLSGSGVAATLRGSVSHIFSSPRVAARCRAYGRMGDASPLFPAMSLGGATGEFEADIATAFPLGMLGQGNFSEMPLSGNIKLHDMNISPSSGAVSRVAADGELTFRSDGRKLMMRAGLRNIGVKMRNGCDMEAIGMKLDVTAGDIRYGSPVSLSGMMDELHVAGRRYSVDALRLDVRAEAPSFIPSAISESVVSIGIDAAYAAAEVDTVSFSARHLSLDGQICRMRLKASAATDELEYADDVNLALLHDMDVALDMDLYGNFNQATLTAPSGAILSAAYPVATMLRNVDLEVSPSRIRLNNLTVASQCNRLSLQGEIDGYPALMNGRKDSLARAVADVRVDVDNLDLNQIAGTLRAGTEMMRSHRGLPPADPGHTAATAPVPSDYRPMLLPRNIDARVRLSAKECVYTNLHLLDMHADMNMTDGILRLDTIYAHTDFGSARASLSYAGADSLHLGMDCRLALDTINVVTFFRRFHTLLEMMPQMSNLSGYVSASLEGGFSLFPDMVIDTPSLTADIHARGNRLKVHQSKFIHRICRLLLIENKEDLGIRDINVHAAIYDNQLFLYPFIMEIDRYRLSFSGENDFAGNMYYHVGVLHSPVPFDFGINVTGTFSDYHIRFGGADFHADKAHRAMHIDDDVHINLVQKIRLFARKFMDKAAEADKGSAHIPLVDASGNVRRNVGSTVLHRVIHR